MEEGSFGRAAARLRKAPSAVSYAVGMIERALGVRLFDRSGPKAVPTAVARSMFDAARDVVGSETRLRELVSSYSGQQQPVVRTAIDPRFSPVAVAQAIVDLRRHHPGVVVRWRARPADEVISLVLGGAVDIGIVGREPMQPELEAARLPRRRLVAVASQDHPLARSSTRVSARQLRRYDEIELASQTTSAPGALSACSLEAVKALVLAGLGWAYVPPESVTSDVDGASGLTTLPAPEVLVPFFAIHARERAPGAAACCLIRSFANAARDDD